MITPTGVSIADYCAVLDNDVRSHARITFLMDNVVFEDSDFNFNGGIQLSTYMNSENDLTFGSACCTEVSICFVRSEKTDELNWNKEFKLEFGTEIGGEIKWVTMGYFTGKRPVKTQKDTIEFVAYDRMARLDRSADDFIDLLTYPCTVRNIYDELCEFVVLENVPGDEIASAMSSVIPDGSRLQKGCTCRDIMRFVAEANCCYSRINNDGKVQLIWYTDHTSDYQLDRNHCFDIDFTDLQTYDRKKWGNLEPYQWKDMETTTYGDLDNAVTPLKVQAIKCVWEDPVYKTITQPPQDGYTNHRVWANVESSRWQDLEQFTWGYVEISEETGEIYVIKNNPLLLLATDADIKAHLQLLVDRLQLLDVYYVATVPAVGNWLIETGDIISLEVQKNVYTAYPIFNRVLTWNGACTCDYESTGSMSRESA